MLSEVHTSRFQVSPRIHYMKSDASCRGEWFPEMLKNKPHKSNYVTLTRRICHPPLSFQHTLAKNNLLIMRTLFCPGHADIKERRRHQVLLVSSL
jgi:hypothetical protein